MSERERFLSFSPEPLDLRDEGRRFPRRHVFEEDDVHAINAALASGRPLLLRGAPGVGKSQLALAAAVGLGRAFVSQVIDARTESRDLLWHFDAVGRLADAQVASVSGKLDARRRAKGEPAEADLLHKRYYTEPGVLWWAFNWDSARGQAEEAGGLTPVLCEGADPENGVVVLLDEIDKADSSLPNGLLEILGDDTFRVPGVGNVPCGSVAPLVVVTTNEERALPDAFLRRCAVHQLALDRDPELLRQWLLRLGQAHFPDFDSKLLEKAAEILAEDRTACLQREVHPPGSAEYLDLLRVVAERESDDPEALLAIARRFLLQKQAR